MSSSSPFPVIETKNLLLRSMTHNDKNDIFQMRKDPRMHDYTDTRPDGNIGETEVYIDKMINGVAEDRWVIWAIEHKESKKVIGSISIWNIDNDQKTAELSYGIIPDYQGRGFMKEALFNIVDYGFNVMKLKSIDAYTEKSNIRSTNLLAKCNFQIIDEVNEQGYSNERIYHMIVYRLEKL